MNDEIKITPKLTWRNAEYPLRLTGSTFVARIDLIYEIADAPDAVRSRMESMCRRAGKPVPTAGLVAAQDPTMGPVLVIQTPETADRIRALLPEARAAVAAEKARAEAEERERAAALERRREEVRAACPADCEPCTLGRWFDGLRECIAADGTRVDQWDDIDAHGCGIAYVRRDILDQQRARDAENRAAAAVREEKREAEKREAVERRAAAFAEAKETGKRVEIRHYATTRCMNGNDDECSLDTAYEYAMPDGTTKTIYVCAF